MTQLPESRSTDASASDPPEADENDAIDLDAWAKGQADGRLESLLTFIAGEKVLVPHMACLRYSTPERDPYTQVMLETSIRALELRFVSPIKSSQVRISDEEFRIFASFCKKLKRVASQARAARRTTHLFADSMKRGGYGKLVILIRTPKGRGQYNLFRYEILASA